MSTKLRVGLVGVGGNGGRFLEAYATNPRVAVAAICDVRDDHRQALQERYSVPHGYADVESLLQDDEVDLVSIHAPDGLHAPFTLAALDAGKHVFVEKPMATSIEDCLQVVERADRATTRMAVGHVLRTRPYFRMVKEMVDAGELGTLYAMRTHYLTDAMRRGPAFLDKARESYSPSMLTMGVHPVDLMRWYAGDVVAVQAMGNQGMAMQGTGNPLDDAVTAVYRFASGATGSITVCWASNYVFDSYYGLELHGSEASVVWDKIHGKEAFTRWCHCLSRRRRDVPATLRRSTVWSIASWMRRRSSATSTRGLAAPSRASWPLKPPKPVRRWKCRIRSVKLPRA